MLENQIMQNYDRVEICLFPLNKLRCGQGPGYVSRQQQTTDSYSHPGSWAVDLAGTNDVYAPVTLKCVKKYPDNALNSAHTVLFTSTSTVIFPNGERDYLYLFLCHCNDISFLKEGTVYKQGTVIYHIGTYGEGNITGPHVHLEARMKKNTTAPSCENNGWGSWGLVGNEPIQDLFFINNTIIDTDVPSVKRVRGFSHYNPLKFSAIGKENGWNSFNNEWYYVLNNSMKVGWYQDGGWYFLNDGRFKDYPMGAMVRDKWVASGSDWYYILNGGVMAYSANNPVNIDGKNYNFSSTGVCLNP